MLNLNGYLKVNFLCHCVWLFWYTCIVVVHGCKTTKFQTVVAQVPVVGTMTFNIIQKDQWKWNQIMYMTEVEKLEWSNMHDILLKGFELETIDWQMKEYGNCLL